MKSLPGYLAGKYPPAPPSGPKDRSNGWFANHPISKLIKYQRFLRDQAKEEAAVAEAGGPEAAKALAAAAAEAAAAALAGAAAAAAAVAQATAAAGAAAAAAA
jgi:hypothetical protein